MSADDLMALRGKITGLQDVPLEDIEVRIDIDSIVGVGYCEHLLQHMCRHQAPLTVSINEARLMRSHLRIQGEWAHNYDSRKIGRIAKMGLPELDVFLLDISEGGQNLETLVDSLRSTPPVRYRVRFALTLRKVGTTPTSTFTCKHMI